jgi:hypothetical protein
MAEVVLPRRQFILGLALAVIVLFGLVVITFARYPGLSSDHGTGPAPVFPAWFGTAGAAIAYIILGGYLLSLYIGLGMLATPSPPQSEAPAGRQPWQIGAFLALVAGVAVSLVGIPVNLLSHFGAYPVIALLAWVVTLVVAGVFGSLATGKIMGGVLAGLWCGIVIALVSSLLGLAVDLVLAPLLVHGAWAQDTTCPYVASQLVAACETSDDLGWFATALTIIPVLGALLGALGGLAGKSGSGASSTPVKISRTAALIPIAFVILQVLLFVGELIWNFW